MKPLKNHILLFDAECNLCSTYSNTLVKTGMLEKDGRQPYQQMSGQTAGMIDTNKARNEIALLNTQTGQVYYGIDSIFTLIANSYPLFKPLFALKPFRWLIKKLYFFISYNRKVIIPGNPKTDNCVPDENVAYRWAYLLFTWLVTSFILTRYSFLLNGLIPESKFFREFIICGGQIVFQSVVIRWLAKGKILTYLGNMMTISFAGALLLVVIMLMGKLFAVTSPVVYACAFMSVVGLMFLEHMRRMKLIGIHWFASISWAIYRTIVLIIILTCL